MPRRCLIRATRLATLDLLFPHVGQERISIFKLSSRLLPLSKVDGPIDCTPSSMLRVCRVHIGDKLGSNKFSVVPGGTCPWLVEFPALASLRAGLFSFAPSALKSTGA